MGNGAQVHSSPVGAKEIIEQAGDPRLSSLAGLVLLPPGNPEINRWAILFRPSGLLKANATPSPRLSVAGV